MEKNRSYADYYWGFCEDYSIRCHERVRSALHWLEHDASEDTAGKKMSESPEFQHGT